MKNSHTFPLLPRIKVGIETQDSCEIEAGLNVRQDKYYSKPKMMRIAYSPLADLKSKENNNRMLLQSYVANVYILLFRKDTKMCGMKAIRKKLEMN